MVLKWRDVYVENIRLKMEVLKWSELLNGGVLNHRDHCRAKVFDVNCHQRVPLKCGQNYLAEEEWEEYY